MVDYTFDLFTVEYFLLILVRVASFIFVAPFFSMSGVPNLTKIGLSCCIALMMLPALQPEEQIYYSVIGYAVLVVRETLTGLLIGYAATICNSIIFFAGNIIDMDIGLSMASEFDPSMNTQVTVTGNLYYYFMLLLMLVSNMHQYLIQALADSFDLIPLGGLELHTDTLLTAFVSYMTNLFIIGFRIVLPVFATMLIFNVVLGIMAKVAPQMNMFSVGVQIKLLAGLAVMYVMIFLFPEAVQLIIDETKINIQNFAAGMQ